MKKSEKITIVKSLIDEVKNAKSLTIVNYQGLAMSDLQSLRGALEKVDGKLTVIKNSLLKLALVKADLIKTDDTTLIEGLQGPTAVIFAGNDEIAPLQTLAKFIREKELPKLKIGFFDHKITDTQTLVTLSKLPNKITLYGKLVGSLAGPAYNLVGTLNANLQKLVYILDQRSKQTLEIRN